MEQNNTTTKHMEKNNMTAFEWLINEIDCVDIGSGMKMHIHIPKCFIEKAKQMEKEQIGQAYMSGLIDGMNQQPKEYYNETFGNK